MEAVVKSWVAVVIGTLALAGAAAAQQAAAGDPVLAVMTQELKRSFGSLKKTDTPVYFLSYQLTDNRAISLASSFGALTGSDEHRARTLDVDLRVGDPSLDNTHPLREAAFSMSELTDRLQAVKMPLEDDPEA